jgi:hypothetical protein
MFALASTGNPTLGTPTGWASNVMEVPVTGAVDGAAYQLAFTVAGGTDNKKDYFTLEASNAQGTAIHNAMSGRVSTPSNKHTFDFIAPVAMTKIVLRRQPGFTGTVTFNSVKRIVNTGNYRTPAPKAVYCEPKAGNVIDLCWWTDTAASMDIAEASLFRTGTQTPAGEMSMPVAFTAGSPTIKHGRGWSIDLPIGARCYLVEEQKATLPAGIPPVPTLLYVRAQNYTSTSFELSLTPDGPALVPSTAGTGEMRLIRYDRTFKTFKGTYVNRDETFSMPGFTAAFARGLRSTRTDRKFNDTWNYSTLGKRHGGHAGKVSQYAMFGPFAYLDSYFNLNLNSHLGRFNTAASTKSVTVSAANPAVVTMDGGAPWHTHEVRFTAGSPPAPLKLNTIYYAKHISSTQIQLTQKPGQHQPSISTAGGAAGSCTMEILGTANANGMTPEGNPMNEGAVGVVANLLGKNCADAMLDSKHPNLWASNVTYDMSGEYDFATHRGLMIHDYTFPAPHEDKGVGFMGVQGYVCPDLKEFDGTSYPIRMENSRCFMPMFNVFIGGEKVISRAHMVKRAYLYELSPGEMSEANYPVYSMPIANAPDEAKWPVLAVAVQVRKSGTNTWYDVPLPYTGPFPAGALQWEINPVGIGGIAAGNSVDVRLGHFDGETWRWAGADGVAAFETLTLKAA